MTFPPEDANPSGAADDSPHVNAWIARVPDTSSTPLTLTINGAASISAGVEEADGAALLDGDNLIVGFARIYFADRLNRFAVTRVSFLNNSYNAFVFLFPAREMIRSRVTIVDRARGSAL